MIVFLKYVYVHIAYTRSLLFVRDASNFSELWHFAFFMISIMTGSNCNKYSRNKSHLNKNGASVCPRLRPPSYGATTRWLFQEGNTDAHQ